MRGLYFRFANMCGSCHRSEIYNDVDFEATNLFAEPNRMFKVPTLLNISLTAPYMHNGSIATLEGVMDHYDKYINQLHKYGNKRIKQPIKNLIISEYDRKNIAKFLSYFSDTQLLTNPEWSDPFLNPNFTWYRSPSNN